MQKQQSADTNVLIGQYRLSAKQPIIDYWLIIGASLHKTKYIIDKMVTPILLCGTVRLNISSPFLLAAEYMHDELAVSIKPVWQRLADFNTLRCELYRAGVMCLCDCAS